MSENAAFDVSTSTPGARQPRSVRACRPSPRFLDGPVNLRWFFCAGEPYALPPIMMLYIVFMVGFLVSMVGDAMGIAPAFLVAMPGLLAIGLMLTCNYERRLSEWQWAEMFASLDRIEALQSELSELHTRAEHKAKGLGQ